MCEISFSSVMWMLAAILVSSGAGFALVRFCPWSKEAQHAGIPQAFALAVAPFLLGMWSTVALGVFRGASHYVHLWVVFLGLILLSTTAAINRAYPWFQRRGTLDSLGRWEQFFVILFALWVVTLMINIALLPLLQNDSLEYATVGRLLFESRDLLACPAINPEINSAGFYGPWTHPPLYAALIYLTYVFQGHADMPGMMIWIAPWFAMVGILLVFALGTLTDRLTGILAVLIFLSTPIFFLGTGSALIDPLPVLGLTMVFAAIVGMDGTPLRRGLLQGIVLGLSLWTHSQAILFVPLAVAAVVAFQGWNDKSALARQIIALLTVALLLAAWPYGRNLLIYGSLISDTPIVFAMQELAWDDYFRISRGLNSWPEKLQYGLLKGWFTFESYALSFWLMLLGLALYARHLMHHMRWANLRRGEITAMPERWIFAAAAVVLCYLCGVLLSMLLNIDLMIRNERYWLVLLPFVALIAGSGLSRLRSGIPSSDCDRHPVRRCFHARWVFPLVSFVFIMQWVGLVLLNWTPYVQGKHGLPRGAGERAHLQEALRNQLDSKIVDEDDLRRVARGETPSHAATDNRMVPESSNRVTRVQRLFMWPQIQAMQYLREHTPGKAIVLTMRPSDMYYSGRRMISYLDPRLLPFYLEKDAYRAWEFLRGLGISYLYIPNYYIPPVYNSILTEIVRRPDLSALVFSIGGHQVYHFRDANNKIEGEVIDFTPGRMAWTQVTGLTVSRNALVNIGVTQPRITMTGGNLSEVGFPLFQRDWSTTWISGMEGWSTSHLPHSNIRVTGGLEYRVDLRVEGKAHVRVWLIQLDAYGRGLRDASLISRHSDSTQIGNLILGRRYSERHFSRRFVAHPDATYIRIGIEQVGCSTMRILKATLTPIVEVVVSSPRGSAHGHLDEKQEIALASPS